MVVNSGYSGFLAQGMLTGWVGISNYTAKNAEPAAQQD
jgi:hypothetical protein